MAGEQKEEMSRGRPDPDPTVLTTDALHREVAHLKQRMDDMFSAAQDLTKEKFDGVADKFTDIEAHRKEQKEDTLREITKAFDANTGAIESLEKIQGIANDRITAVEAGRQGAMDMRVAIFATIGLVITIFTVLAANGVFSGG